MRSITNRGSTLRKVDASNFELHYSVPNDQTVNNSYHQYVNSNFQTDITYADLDLSTPNEVTNKVDNERAIYAEITHNVGWNLLDDTSLSNAIKEAYGKERKEKWVQKRKDGFLIERSVRKFI